MKVNSKETTVVTVALSEKEAGLLSALVDFPSHGDQPTEIKGFLQSLGEKLSDIGIYDDAESAGFVNKTSVED